MKLLLVALLIVELTSSAYGQLTMKPAEPMPITQKASLCSVLRRPRVFQSRLVEIQADVLLAMPDGAALFDRACPRRGIQLGIDLPQADASVTGLVPSLLNDCSDAPHRQGLVAGKFTGKLGYSAEGRLNLRLLSVRELDVKPCVPPTPSSLPRMPSAASRE